MRDPNRLDNFYTDFRIYHKKYFPDIRFGQLCCNFFGWIMSEKESDVFYIEENRMLDLLKEYCETHSKKRL